MTRRELLLQAARFGSVSFAYGLLENLDLLLKLERIDLRGLAGSGPPKGRVLILGAGLAGMCAAYELEQLGYECRIIEARKRIGGRCVTVRRGDELEDSAGSQRCEFAKGQFFNPGPTRVPHWHVTIDYCQKFGVKLAPWINVNEGAFIYQTKSKSLQNRRIRIRDVVADTEGYMAQLMAQSVHAGALDTEISADDKARILAYIAQFGYFDEGGKYTGRSRRSYREAPHAGPGAPSTEPPFALSEVFGANMGRYFEFLNGIDQQMTMLEIVGGVDNLAHAFRTHLRAPIALGCHVTDIRTSTAATTVTHTDADGDSHTETADFCICTIPLTILRTIPNNFDATCQSVLKRTSYSASTKVALEFKRRFWEEDDRIFGGISWTDQTISQVVYPSHDFFGNGGVLVNYNFGLSASTMGAMAPKDRIAYAIGQTALIHPQVKDELRSAVTLSWGNVPMNKGAFADWRHTPDGEAGYQLLCKPQGRLYFAGEHASRITSWMAGAFESARYVVRQIHAPTPSA